MFIKITINGSIFMGKYLVDRAYKLCLVLGLFDSNATLAVSIQVPYGYKSISEAMMRSKWRYYLGR